MSTSSSTVISRSSTNSFTYGSSIRAVTFQSMSRMSSPGMYWPHLGERDAAPLEDGVVLPRHPIAHQAFGDDLDPADPLEQLAGQHGECRATATGASRYGTSTRSNSLRTTVSAVMSSASAS